MARFTRNNVEGKSEEARSGWRSRRDKARAKRSARGGDRAAIAAIRAAHAQTAHAADEVAFNPEVQTTAQGARDFIGEMSDADLVALYKQLHEGRAPNGKAKRPAVERAVRAKQAERAAQAANPVGEGNTELPTDELALDEADRVEDDV